MRQIMFLAYLFSVTSIHSENDVKNWHGWDTYQIIMWSTGEPKNHSLWFDRLKEIGFSAEECGSYMDPDPYIRNSFNFYVENLISELAFLHSRRALYDTDYQGYIATKDKSFLIRKPCFDDPSFWSEIKPRLQNLIKKFEAHKPLLYNLRDELSIGSFASPMDYCFSIHTLTSFRQWLGQKYSSLRELNEEWDTEFASWDEVEPMTTYEIKDRERKALKEKKLENYAPWADHREYMDTTFANTLAKLRDFIHEIDPNVPVGIEGTQMPSAWGGYDLWKLSQVIDWVEPYDIACSHKIFRSFLPKSAPVLSTVFGDDFNRIRQRLWSLLLNGDKGCIVWDDEKSRCIDKDKNDLPITDRGKGLMPIFAELKKFAPIIFKLEPLNNKIAIHYSQASIRAHWMFDSREDGDTWHRRFSSYEAKHSRLAQVRDSFLSIIKDLGFQCDFISYEQIENGDLLKKGYKALILPQSVAMSKKECSEITEFVKQGGLLIADNMTATMDEHCKRLNKGQLDELFCIQRNSVEWKPLPAKSLPEIDENVEPLLIYEDDIKTTAGKASYTDDQVPFLIENHVGKGRTVYLNIDMKNYKKYRLYPHKMDNYLECIRNILRSSGIETEVKVLDENGKPVNFVEIWQYKGENARYIAIMKSFELEVDSLGHAVESNNTSIEKSIEIRISFNHKVRVKDIINDELLGVRDNIIMDLPLWMPIILEIGDLE